MWILLTGLALALPELRLPPGEDPALWRDPATLAGLQAAPGDDGVVVIHAGDTWAVEAILGGKHRSQVIPPVTTAGEREDALLVGLSLLRALEARRTWTVLVSVAPVYGAPRAEGSGGAGGELGVRLHRGWASSDLRVRASTARALGGGEQWWIPVDVRLGGGWHSGGRWDLGVGPVVGLSVRTFGERTDTVQQDLKPFVGAATSLERALSARWRVGIGVDVDVDLGSTRIEGRGTPYTLGPVEVSGGVALVWVVR